MTSVSLWRQVPYRIFLGALSLAAGHLGLSFTQVVERLMGGEAAAVWAAAAGRSAAGTAAGPASEPAAGSAPPVQQSPAPAPVQQSPVEPKKKTKKSAFSSMNFFIKPK